MQDKSDEKDTENCQNVNKFINNPTAGQENAPLNSNQQQLMDILKKDLN